MVRKKNQGRLQKNRAKAIHFLGFWKDSRVTRRLFYRLFCFLLSRCSVLCLSLLVHPQSVKQLWSRKIHLRFPNRNSTRKHRSDCSYQVISVICLDITSWNLSAYARLKLSSNVSLGHFTAYKALQSLTHSRAKNTKTTRPQSLFKRNPIALPNQHEVFLSLNLGQPKQHKYLKYIGNLDIQFSQKTFQLLGSRTYSLTDGHKKTPLS